MTRKTWSAWLRVWTDWLHCLAWSLQERNWRSVMLLVRRPRFSAAVIWCYANGLGTWCEWTCGLPGLSARNAREKAPTTPSAEAG